MIETVYNQNNRFKIFLSMSEMNFSSYLNTILNVYCHNSCIRGKKR